jgi:hypothetical protein
MARTYHLGLVKAGENVVLEIADTVDALSCETWKYLGERENTVKNLKRANGNILRGLNDSFGTTFKKLQVRRIPSRDLRAGHVQQYL